MDPGTYQITASLVDDITGRNYNLIDNVDFPLICTLNITTITQPFPKAVLTRQTFAEPETLHFFYDTKIYPLDGYIKAVYNVSNTSYNPETNEAIYPE